MKKYMKKYILAVLLVPVALAMTACPTQKNDAQKQAQDKANSHQVYVPTHDLEFNNYNNRQRIADDPSTILWCTFAWPIPSSPLVTIPILGKLTSGTKRPFSTNGAWDSDNSNPIADQQPGPDGMYGPSDPNYRYGFTPGGNYYDFSELPMTCTNQPTAYQRDSTTIALATDPTLLQAQQQAQAAIQAGHPDQAQAILQQAINGVQGGK